MYYYTVNYGHEMNSPSKPKKKTTNCSIMIKTLYKIHFPATRLDKTYLPFIFPSRLIQN